MKNRTLLVVIGAVVLVLGLAGVAVLAGGGDDANSGASETTTASAPAGDLEQNREVVVTGTAVPTLDSSLESDPVVGTAFPVFEGQSFDGTPVTVGGATDGPTMVVYLAHWCPHCNNEIPELIELQNGGGLPDDMTVVGVSTGVDPSAPNYPPSEWLVDKDWPWETMADDVNSGAFLVGGGSGFPYLVILDADGNIVARDSGEKTADDLATWIQESLVATA